MQDATKSTWKSSTLLAVRLGMSYFLMAFGVYRWSSESIGDAHHSIFESFGGTSANNWSHILGLIALICALALLIGVFTRSSTGVSLGLFVLHVCVLHQIAFGDPLSSSSESWSFFFELLAFVSPFFFAAAGMIIFGPGRWSVDAYRKRKREAIS